MTNESAESRMEIHRRLIAYFFFLTVCVSSPVLAAESWIRVTTPNFEMYTTNNEKDAARALRVFEQVRYFFIKKSSSKEAPHLPVRIIAFRSEREYAPYRLSAGAFAYYIRSHNRDYIVMQDINPEHYPAAIHEYTHLIVQNLNLEFPIWLNEGLAELYSSLEPRGNQAMVGGILPGRIPLLKSESWLDLKLLMSVDQNSPYYNERDKMSVFYAESWALTHMLEFDETYRSGFPHFLSAVASGKSAEDCLKSIYGKDLNQVSSDLHSYVNRYALRAMLFDINLPHSSLDAQSAPLSALQIDLALADLLACRKQTWGEASKRLRELAQNNPENLEIQESIAYLEWERNQNASARDHVARAVQLGSTDPDVLYLYAQLLHQTNAPDKDVLATLEQVVAARPSYTDAQFNLAMTAMNMQNWQRAAKALSSIKTIKPDRAFSVFAAIATCDLALGNIDAARAAAAQAQPYAKTAEEKRESAQLMAQFQSIQTQPSPAPSPADAEAELTEAPKPSEAPKQETPSPTASSKPEPDHPESEMSRDRPTLHWAGDLRHVEGIAQTVECHGKQLRLHVQVNSQPMVFQIDDPNAIVLRNAGAQSIELSCGPQKPFHLGVFYVPSPELEAVTGKVRELVF